MTPETAVWLQAFFIRNMEGEHAITMRVLESCPADRLGYRANQGGKSFTHIVMHIYDRGIDYLLVARPELGSRTARVGRAPRSKSSLKAHCAPLHFLLTDGFRSLSPDALVSEVSFHDERFPAILMADWHVVHVIHHRGQLCAYLEDMRVAVPPIYGTPN
ncbi:MAG: hypothetical protein HY678_05485 [Chloroflexi bacterium]|nr:hypothetical protein [Chloroflexota bacterium]